MEIIEIYNEDDFMKAGLTRSNFVEFLHGALQEYGDPKEHIGMAIDYAFSDNEAKGGFVLAAVEGQEILGGLIMNRTGMKKYIPENILVYVAVDEKTRGQGVGKKLCQRSFDLAEGDVALHVEYDNPAKGLYEHLGLTSKYAEMRLIRG